LIDTSEDLARLEYGEAHVALRAGPRPDHPDYVVSSFGGVSFNLYAHDSYVARSGLPARPDDMSGHTFVLPDVPEGRLPFGLWIKEHLRPEMIAMTSRDIWVMGEAISAGIGIGFMGDHEAGQRGNLQAVLPPNPDWAVPSWIVTHLDLHRTEKVQAMLDCIKLFRPSTSPL
jgi:DNA-binding transcriptional LysR family regulator